MPEGRTSLGWTRVEKNTTEPISRRARSVESGGAKDISRPHR